MAFRRDNELNMEQVAAFLKDAVSKVEASPDELEELKKVFKKNVPLLRRNYVAAYLLKQAGGAIYRFGAHRGRDDFRPRREREFTPRYNKFDDGRERIPRDRDGADGMGAGGEPRERYTRVQIDPDAAATVFVGIGRNRRVFPRDIVGLFISVAGLEKERIGDIRVLANYSFVQLFKEDAEKAIASLNGYEYRGRKLSVSYSRQRSDDEGGSFGEERVPDVSNESSRIVDSFTATNSETVAQQAAFAAQQASSGELSDEEILAARAPRSSSTSDVQ